jgi:hypothetical protein
MKKVNSYPLPAEGLDAMKRYRDTMQKMDDDVRAIQEKAQAEAEAVHNNALDELKRIWYEMAALAGIDAEKTWISHEWGVDARYVDHGFAVINHVQMPKQVQAPWMPGMPESAPPGETLN